MSVGVVFVSFYEIFQIFPSWSSRVCLLQKANITPWNINERHRICFDDNFWFKWQFYWVCCVKCCKCFYCGLRFFSFLFITHHTSDVLRAWAVAVFKTKSPKSVFRFDFNKKVLNSWYHFFLYKIAWQKTRMLSFHSKFMRFFAFTTILHFAMILDMPQNHVQMHSKIYMPIWFQTKLLNANKWTQITVVRWKVTALSLHRNRWNWNSKQSEPCTSY